MSDESEIVTTAAITPPVSLPRSNAADISWRQTLLGTLIVGHVALPFLFRIGVNSVLLQDATLVAQVSLLLIAMTLGGLRWPGITLLLLGSATAAVGWFLAYPSYLHEYVLTSLIMPIVVLAGSLMILRLRGCRGAWTNKTTAPARPWQVSILGLLMVTTVAAGSLAVASWLREFPDAGYWVIMTVDGLGTAALSLVASWALGTRGSGGLKFLVLLGATIFLAGCQIYAFRMEVYWQLSAIMSLCWVMITGGSLFVWRVCDWQVIWNQRAELKLANSR